MIAFGAAFTLHNAQLIDLDLLWVTLNQVSLAAAVIGAFIVGGLLGLLVSLLTVIGLRTKIMRQQRQLRRYHQQSPGFVTKS
jgi:uncharacterized integral membrane protein